MVTQTGLDKISQRWSVLPQISVIIPIYNGEQDLPGLIDCLLSQTYPPERVEYLLVDNGSCDRTPELIEQAVNQASAQNLTFRHLNEPHIQSAYAARNTGIRSAIGEFIAFTDADCHPQPDWLIALVQPFVDPDIGLVVGEIKALPGNNWLEHYAERKNILSQKDTLAHPFCPYGQTANIAVRTQALQQVGLFRPHMTTGGDADICWRIQQQGGWKLQFAEQSIIQHQHRKTLRDLRSQWRRYGRSNRYLHELYGVPLTRSLKAKEVRYRLARWLLKEFPMSAYQFLTAKGPAIDMLMTPIDLYCAQARAKGQEESRLPEEARAWSNFQES
ncbi:MAG: glycosyltransferase [Leptolyngbyaceae cyanobacterium MO_188.B28]|nr:glycosyltransferase [Leptolyngbyaceae cyanobacterium MO_188.B28]